MVGKKFDFVLSVDTTRVEIREADPDVSGSDYINANYIRVSLFSSKTQPSANTLCITQYGYHKY